MAPRDTVIDLTQSDDDDDQPTALPRAPTIIPASAEIVDLVSDDEDEDAEGDGEQDDTGDLIEPLLLAIAEVPNPGPRPHEPPIELPPPLPATAPTPASPRRDRLVRSAEVVLHLFSDGSFIKNRFGGAGVSWRDNITWHGRSVALGRVKSSFDAEMHAILEGLKAAHAIVNRRLDVTKVIVQTDCEACITALAQARAAGGGHNGLLDQVLYQETLMKSRVHDVKLWWVKGHSDSVGNDIADNLARYGAVQSQESPANWGIMTENPPSMKLHQANKLRHGDRKPRRGVEAPPVRRAQKEAKRRERMASRA